MYFLPSSECASSCWCIAEGRQSPCYCVSQGRNQSTCLQEMHVGLLFPSPSMFVSSPLTIRSHKQSMSTKVSKLDQPQDIWLCPRGVKVFSGLITTTAGFFSCNTKSQNASKKKDIFSLYHS